MRGIDNSVAARIERIASYTVTEHYAVFRNGDEAHAAAEMTVRTDYRKDLGKEYTILSQSGSSLLRSQIFGRMLEEERAMSRPGTRETVLVNSANYRMALAAVAPQTLDGRSCLLLTITPLRSSPSLFQGNLWVDARDYSIVRLEGMATKSRSMLTGAAQVARQYAPIDGFPMATHAVAISKSSLLGLTTIRIDYSDYQIRLQPGS